MGLRWDPVAGADEYIVSVAELKDRYDGVLEYSVKEIAVTRETDILHEDISGYDNNRFNSDLVLSKNIESYFVFVQSVSNGFYSNISNPLHSRDIVSILPTSIYRDPYSDDAAITREFDTIDEVGVFRAIEVLDGSTVLMPVSATKVPLISPATEISTALCSILLVNQTARNHDSRTG